MGRHVIDGYDGGWFVEGGDDEECEGGGGGGDEEDEIESPVSEHPDAECGEDHLRGAGGHTEVADAFAAAGEWR